MSKFFEQTWWKKHLPKEGMYETFIGWIGGEESEDIQTCVNFVSEHKIRSMVDLGCGPCLIYNMMKEKNPDTAYYGLDSCDFFQSINEQKGINFSLGIIEETNFRDNQFELAYSRHVLEHLPCFEDALSEMIRISNRYVVHKFFYTPVTGRGKRKFFAEHELYTNVYSLERVEDFLRSHEKVKSFTWGWEDVATKQKALIIEV